MVGGVRWGGVVCVGGVGWGVCVVVGWASVEQGKVEPDRAWLQSGTCFVVMSGPGK